MRRLVPRAAVLVLVILAIVIVALSPFALDDLGGSAAAWARRASIGQTYGAAAALLAVLALAGVVVSLVLQARETKVNREHDSREAHNALLRLALDDPAYMECWGAYVFDGDERAERQFTYVNMIVSYWQNRYELGTFTDEHLRFAAREIFEAQPGRMFWASNRDDRTATYQTRRERRFHAIIDDEYRDAIARTPTLPPKPPRRIRLRRDVLAVTAALAVGTAAAGWRLHRNRG